MFKDLSTLFASSARAKILKFFVFQPNVRITAQSAGSAIGVPKAVAEREVRALAKLGILIAKKQKKQTLFFANQSHSSLPAIRAFLDAETLPDERSIFATFRGTPGISLIVASGVLAREERSAVDFLIVARKSKNPGIAKAVAKVERLVALPLRYVVLEPEVYAERKEAHDRLIRDVFEFQHRLIVGRS